MGQVFKIDGVDSHLKNRKYKFYLDGIKLSQFENKFKQWPQWTQFKREIKLNTLLNGKRIQFDIEDINEYGKLSGRAFDPMMSDIVFTVKCISMIIKDDFVEELEIEWRPLQSDLGRTIIGILDAGLEIDISIHFDDNDQFVYFYIKEEKNIA
jgi:hypothetical protein